MKALAVPGTRGRVGETTIRTGDKPGEVEHPPLAAITAVKGFDNVKGTVVTQFTTLQLVEL